MATILNIGLKASEHASKPFRPITLSELHATLRRFGYLDAVTGFELHTSASEPTAVLTIGRTVCASNLRLMSEALEQDCIAAWDGQRGRLGGDKAEAWGPFNPEFFLMPGGQRLAVPATAA
jgi:hypothetical protein